ncbi:hypothetical protein B0H13DRAFT_2336659 [Mycena leptocephala]|nr:hypothetical protein B0H13DRAFT_2336659 [Mycena leptocephala]
MPDASTQTDLSVADEIGCEFKRGTEAIQRVDGRLEGTPSEELLGWLAANIVPEKRATPLFEDTFSEKEKREFQEMKRALVADLMRKRKGWETRARLWPRAT